jgi:MFS family permease
MLFSLVLSVGTTALFAFVYEPIWFFPIVALSAISWSTFSVISFVIASDLSTTATRGTIMGIYFTAIGASLLVGPLLCSLLILFIGFRELFLVSTFFPMLALILFAFVANRSEIDMPSIGAAMNVDRVSTVLGSIYRVFRIKNVVAMYYAQVAFAISFGVFSTLFSIYAEGSLRITPSIIALLFSVRAFTNLLIRLPAGRVSDRIGRRRPVIISHAIFVVVFALLPFTRNLAILGLLIALYGVGWGMRVAPDAALVSESVASADRPIALAILMTMFDVGIALGSLMVGVSAMYLSIPDLFFLCAPILLSGLLALIYFTRETLNL